MNRKELLQEIRKIINDTSLRELHDIYVFAKAYHNAGKEQKIAK